MKDPASMYTKGWSKAQVASAFIVVFYTVGALGVASPFARSFLLLTPLHMLTVAGLLAWCYGGAAGKGLYFVAFVFVFGLAVEVVGINTGYPFGEYAYGAALGPKVLETPLLIGLNWVFMVYICWAVSAWLFRRPWLRVLMAAVGITASDVLMEPGAINAGFWSWATLAPPMENYLSWFFIGAVMMLFAEKYLQKPPLLPPLVALVCNLIFFSHLVSIRF